MLTTLLYGVSATDPLVFGSVASLLTVVALLAYEGLVSQIGRKGRHMDQKNLEATFRKLGAPDPESWARSEIDEGVPQLARYLFLRQAWRNIVKEGDSRWIENAIERARTRPDDPCAGVGHALTKLRARGATDEEITDVVRGMQAELLFCFCYLLEDPGDLEPEVKDVAWVLAQVDADGNVLGTIGGLHESVLGTDPTGREMRPRRGSAG